MTRTAAPAPTQADGARPGRPDAATLRQLYVVERRPLTELTTRYRVGKPVARQWLVEAGIPIRARGSGGWHRQLEPPPATQLAAWVEQGLTVPQLAAQLTVAPSTVRRWLTEAGVQVPISSLKNRPRGKTAPVNRPSGPTLRQLYVQENLSIVTVAARLGATTHLVRTWLLEDGVALRPAGGRRPHPARGIQVKPSPPIGTLRALRDVERLSIKALAARYRVHPATAARWLRAAGLPTRLPPAPGPVTDADLVSLYQREPVSAAEIARRVGLRPERVLDALHRAGVAVDPARQAAAVARAGAARRGSTPSLPGPPGDLAVALYQQEGRSYRQIAEELGVSSARVRGELKRRGVTGRRQPVAGPNSRAGRQQVPSEDVWALYAESEWTAQEVAARLDVSARVVLRTGHAYGVPIRQGGHPAVSATVALINGLYADALITAALDRHQVPRRAPGGDIATRFPEPVPLTASLLDDLYTQAGCSSNQIELLTGQSQAVIRATMHRLGIHFRDEHMSPALYRLRAAARDAFLASVVEHYHQLGSTQLVADLHGCAPATVRRWLRHAGTPLPGRGRWSRARSDSRTATARTPEHVMPVAPDG